MKNVTLAVVITLLGGCSTDNESFLGSFDDGIHREKRITHYIHLTVGDSLGYGAPNHTNSGHYATVTGIENIRGKTYYRFKRYLIGNWPPEVMLMREDSDGNIFIAKYDSSEALLYRTNVEVGTIWIHPVFETLSCTLESRTDTIRTTYGMFANCLRIKIGCEYQWLAPNVGLVKRDYQCPTLSTVFLMTADLKDIRLKSKSHR